MGGIAGAVWWSEADAVEQDAFQRAGPSRDRGPIVEHYFFRREHRLRPPYEPLPGVVLGLMPHAAEATARPATNESGSVVAVCDGEFHNRGPLRRRLEGSGHRFSGTSDAELLAHLYEDDGEDCFSHVSGPFAAAVWDVDRRRLLLGVDRWAQRSLYYRREARRLVFAGRLRNALALTNETAEIDPSAVDEYLTYGYVPPPGSIYATVNKLAAGTRAVYSDDGLAVARYWQPPSAPARPQPGAPQAAGRLLERAILSGLSGRGELAVVHDGSISPVILAAAARAEGIAVCSIHVPAPGEPPQAAKQIAASAESTGCRHQTAPALAATVSSLREALKNFDEPVLSPAIWTLPAASALASAAGDVLALPTGAAELLLLGSRYHSAAREEMWSRSPPLRSLLGLAATAPGRHLRHIAVVPEAVRAGLYRDEFVARLGDCDPLDLLISAWPRGGRGGPAQAAECDLQTRPSGRDLPAARWACPPETTLLCPFLDAELVSLVTSLPARQRREGNVFREAYGEVIPRRAFAHRRRAPFPQLSTELRSAAVEVLSSAECRISEFLQPAAVARLAKDASRPDTAYRLLALAVLELWLCSV